MKCAPKVVKSVQRTLDVLEHFGPDRHEATASEIARELGYPISSTAELLWSMVELGYLSFNQTTRNFRPTAKLPLLGHWVSPQYFKSGLLLHVMEELAQATGKKVALATREGLSVRYLHVVTADGTQVRGDLVRGSGRCMFHSAIGRLLLSQMPAAQIPKVVHRINSEVASEWRVRPSELICELEDIKKRKYEITVDGVTPNGGCVAISLPNGEGGEEFALGIGGSADDLRDCGSDLLGVLESKSKQFMHA